MMVCLLGLLRTERLAREMSAVTRVMDILKTKIQHTSCYRVNKQKAIKAECTGVYMMSFLPALKLVFQKVKERFLHHVCHLKTKHQT